MKTEGLASGGSMHNCNFSFYIWSGPGWGLSQTNGAQENRDFIIMVI